jgi:uncharacterized membrane protein
VRTPPKYSPMSPGRLESFSDGVLAVAITLLVLNLVVPEPKPGHQLSHDLGELWPQYLAYATSFVTVGIIWINHHATISRLRSADHTVLFVNIMLLMSVVLLPFTTNLMATYLRAGHGEHLAAAVYSGSLLLMGLMFSLLNRHIFVVAPGLMRTEMAPSLRRRLLIRHASGVTPYVLATALAAVSPYLTLAITAAVAVFYALPWATPVGLDGSATGTDAG